YQSLDISCPGRAGVNDEIGMFLGNAGAADAVSLESAGFDEPRRVIAFRIPEYRAAVRQVDRLRRAPFGQQRSNPLPANCGIARLKLELASQIPFILGPSYVAVADREIVRTAVPQRTGAVDRQHSGHQRPCFAAECARV